MKHRKSTFTIVELLVSLVIFGIIATALATIYQVGGYASKDGMEQFYTSSYIRKEYSQLVSDYKSAKDVSVSEDRMILLNDDGQQINYFYDTGILYRNGEEFITHIAEIEFKQESSYLLRVHIALKYDRTTLSPPDDFYINKRH